MNYEPDTQIFTDSELRQVFETEVIPQGEFILFRTQLFELPWDIPQTKMDWGTCQGWTEGWCPTTTNPWRRCRWIADYPCWKMQRRTVRYGFVLEHRIPARMAENFQEQLKECHRNALEIAKDIVRQGAISGGLGAIFGGNPFQAPLAALQEGLRAIPVGIRWYLRLMEQCVERIFEGMGQQIKRHRPIIRRITTRDSGWR